MKTKEITIFAVLVILVIAIILIINYIKANGNHPDEIIKCIADNSILVVSKTCSHCINQKKILEPYLDYFNILEISEHPELNKEYNIIGVPTWIINNQTYAGGKSIEELKQLTGC